jgi:hypothetical protein
LAAGDTLNDDELLLLLRDHNAGERALQPLQ